METIDLEPADPCDELEGIDPAIYHRRNLILATMCLSLVLVVATVSSVNVAIPHLAQSALRPTDTQVLWIVDAYALVFAVLLLPAGAIGDRFGRKGALLSGLGIFAAASLLSARMTDVNALIAFRGLAGLGAALIMPSTLSLLQSAFPSRERAKAIAVWAGFAGAGGALGPLLGGVLVEHFWYGSVFLVAFPLAMLGFAASAWLAPRSREAGRPKLDPIGSVLSIAGFTALLVAIIEGPHRGWTSPVVLAGFVLAVVGLVGFVMFERRTDEPMLDMRFFRIPLFAAGSLGITVVFFSMFAMFFVITQYMQYVRGNGALAAGVQMLPFSVAVVLFAARSADWAVRYGVRAVVTTGFVIAGLAVFGLSFVTAGTSYWILAVLFFVCGGGIAIAMPSLSSGIVQSVPQHKAGVGSAVNDTTREIGGAIGIAALGSIVTSVYRSRLGSAFDGLPPDLAGRARENVGQALEVAQRDASGAIGSPAAGRLVDSVRHAFLAGAHLSLQLAAVAIAVVSAVVWRQLGKVHAGGDGARRADREAGAAHAS